MKEPENLYFYKDVTLNEYKSKNIDNWKMNDYINCIIGGF